MKPALFPRLARLLAAAALALACLAPAPSLRAAEGDTIPCAACRGGGACQAKGCKEGKTPCPATCLKPDAPGWHKRKIEGFPDDYQWMAFKFKDGTNRIQYISDRHMGELIEHDENGKPVSRGRCPKCEGSSRLACATCDGDAKCKTCGGSGNIAAGGEKLTLTDSQGRALEAIVRSRQGDTITVMRLPDQKVFDVPLSKLSAESNELVEQKFPARR